MPRCSLTPCLIIRSCITGFPLLLQPYFSAFNYFAIFPVTPTLRAEPHGLWALSSCSISTDHIWPNHSRSIGGGGISRYPHGFATIYFNPWYMGGRNFPY